MLTKTIILIIKNVLHLIYQMVARLLIALTRKPTSIMCIGVQCIAGKESSIYVYIHYIASGTA